ncbi:NECAP endocytosis associated 1 [Phyllostomus discolor]|uniref:NECAP endocytosis associated 1 n=1 Tax=Phyllostomus discolor TaxID=89673 RepID=A0A834EH19_9CHIR|nr:NECAP endocytosis associated 1 [Phyllostomus discolor]
MAAELEYESVLCVKPDVSVYRIPPRASNRGYRGALCSGTSRTVSWYCCGDCDRFQPLLCNPDPGWDWWVKQESEISKESQEMDTRPKLDLGFKEGQTIKLSIGNITTKKGGTSKPKTAGTGGLSLLPPPPGGKVTIPPPSSVAISNHVTPPPLPKSNHGGSDADILLDLDSPAPVTTPAPAPVSTSNDLWGDFSTAPSSVPNQAPQPSNWVQF